VRPEGLSKLMLTIQVQYNLLYARAHCSWLRQYATSRKIAGSSHDEVTEFLQFTSSHTMALGLTQALTEMSTRSRKVMFLGSKERPAYKADTCERIV
jgi:hypothetical protein